MLLYLNLKEKCSTKMLCDNNFETAKRIEFCLRVKVS